MKTILLLSSFFVYSNFFAQNQAPLFDTPLNQAGTALHGMISYPNDPSKLLLIQVLGESSYSYNFYSYDESKNLTPAPTVVCGSSSTLPIEVDNGILFGGNTYSSGAEPVFFDGSEAYILDVNSGANGSSPEFYQFEERTFFTAFNGVNRQLFEYLSPTSYIQISNETLVNVEFPVGVSQNNVFFRTTVQDSIRSLKKATFLNNSYSIETLRTQNGLFFNWTVFGEINNRVLIAETDISFYYGTLDLQRILSYDSNWDPTVIEESNYVESLGLGWKSFKFNNEMYFMDGYYLRKTVDGLTISLENTLTDAAMLDYFVHNDYLCFTASTMTDSNKIYKLENNQFNLLYTGFHIHTSFSDGTNTYFTDWVPSGMSKYVKMDVNDEITTFDVTSTSDHPIVNQESLMWLGKPTFIWGESYNNDNYLWTNLQIFQLDETLGLDVNEFENKPEVFIYPNPVQFGHDVIVKVSEEFMLSIIDETGREIVNVELSPGENHVSTNNLTSGVYFLRVGTSTKKVVIE